MRLHQIIDGFDRIIEVPDVESTIAVLVESGWEPAPELVQTNPALAPGEIEPEPEPKRRSRKTEPVEGEETPS